MEIALLRHGKPAIDTSGRLGASDFGKWVIDYDCAGIDDRDLPPPEAYEKAATSSFTVCSDLLRAIQSANALNIDEIDLISDLFRECEMPYADWKYPKLSKQAWAILFRIFQLAGYANNAESYQAIKLRSARCALILSELAREHGSILLIGHGALIWFIHKQLLRMGWTGPRKAARKHWEFGVYSNR